MLITVLNVKLNLNKVTLLLLFTCLYPGYAGYLFSVHSSVENRSSFHSLPWWGSTVLLCFPWELPSDRTESGSGDALTGQAKWHAALVVKCEHLKTQLFVAMHLAPKGGVRSCLRCFEFYSLES